MNRRLIPLIVFIGLLVLLAVGLTLDPRQIPSPLVGKAAPSFRLPNLANPTATLGDSDLRGQVYLLNVWASWCVSCRQEHPRLVKLAKAGTVHIYGLNYKDQREDALRWLDRFGNPYLASASDLDGRVGIDYGVYGVPESYLIDKKGFIRHKYTGPLSDDDIQHHLLPLVQQLEKEG